jgi:hypothetical protein
MGARQAFERVVAALEGARPGGDLRLDNASVERALAPIARRAGRGAVIVFFSDLIDLPDSTLDRLAALASRDRVVIAVRVLDPVETLAAARRPPGSRDHHFRRGGSGA